MRSVRYLEEAREEFLHEVEYFTTISPGLGERFDRAVQKAEALAAEFADMNTIPANLWRSSPTKACSHFNIANLVPFTPQSYAPCGSGFPEPKCVCVRVFRRFAHENRKRALNAA